MRSSARRRRTILAIEELEQTSNGSYFALVEAAYSDSDPAIALESISTGPPRKGPLESNRETHNEVSRSLLIKFAMAIKRLAIQVPVFKK